MVPKRRAILGDILIGFDRIEVPRSSQAILATSLEFRLLKFFVDNPNRVLSRKDLIPAAWTKRKRASLRTVDNSISNLRRKLEKDLSASIFFQTVRSEGYRFAATGLTLNTSSSKSHAGQSRG
jgi:DNA-binding response OmpR family regulator